MLGSESFASGDNQGTNTPQVSWFSLSEDGPKKLHRRANCKEPWVRVTKTGGNEFWEFHEYQNLRRKGYVLVTKEGDPIVDDKGEVIGNTLLPPSKVTYDEDVLRAAIDIASNIDMESIPEGVPLPSVLLTLQQRIDLMRFQEMLEEQSIDTLIGLAFQAIVYVSTPDGQNKSLRKDSLITTLPPAFHTVGDTLDTAKVLGQTILELAVRADREALLDILKKVLPQALHLQSFRIPVA
jgi:hypothetical protein